MANQTRTKFALLAALLISSCQEGNFSGDSGRGALPSKKPLRPCVEGESKNCQITGPQPITPNNPTLPGGGPTNQNKPLVSIDDGGTCLNRAPTIDFVFAMDVSGSMQNESDRVNAAFLTLANNLANITIPGLGKVEKVRFGLVTYEDNIIYQSALSDQVDLVKASISANFRALERGSDPSEAGFLAASTALQLASSGGDSVKVIFLATDAYSHDGGGIDGSRTYDASWLVQALASTNMKSSFLFTATDPYGGSGNIFNIPSGSAQTQWVQVRAAAGVRGKDYNIANFSTSTVSNDIPSFIQLGLRKCK